MSRAAQAVADAVKGLKIVSRKTPTPAATTAESPEKPSTEAAADAPTAAAEAKPKKTAKKATAKKPTTGRRSKTDAAAPGSATSGLKANPKRKIVRLNTVGARAVVGKALQAMIDSGVALTVDEKFDADRILARIAHRS